MSQPLERSVTPPSRTFLLAGQDNVGRSTLFERLCDRQEPERSGHPGAIRKGTWHDYVGEALVLCPPGANTIFMENEDEVTTKRLLLDGSPTGLLFVADARNLKRSLTLLLHYADFGVPLLIVLNMVDEALVRNLRVDADRLARLLGVPVVSTVAVEGGGVNNLRSRTGEVARLTAQLPLPGAVRRYLEEAEKVTPGRRLARGLLLSALAEDDVVRHHLDRRLSPDESEALRQLITATKNSLLKAPDLLLLEVYQSAAEHLTESVLETTSSPSLPLIDRVGMWARNPITGIPIALAVLSLMFLVVGKLGAEFLVEQLEGRLFGELLVPATRTFLEGHTAPPLLVRALVGEFGLLSTGLALSLGLVMPVLLTFYAAFGLLENSGYMVRLAVLLHRTFRRIGLSGKAVLPVILGFSCITMAVLSTRILNHRRERILATLLLVLGIPCAPLLSVMLVLLGDLPVWGGPFIFGFVLLQVGLVGHFANRLLPGRPTPLLLEIPPLRLPKLFPLLHNALRRTWFFLHEALPVFLLATFLLFVLDEAGGIALLERLAAPVLSGLIGLPPESVNVFLLSTIRREAGVALLADYVHRGAFTPVQIVINLLLVTFLIPCVNTILVIVKELGTKAALAICAFVVTYALLLGSLLNLVLNRVVEFFSS